MTPGRLRLSGRLPGIDWPVALIVAAVATVLALRDGGYFPTDWGWSSLLLFWIAAAALFLRDRFRVGRLELALLASLAALIGWIALSATWSSSVERSILEAQRALVYLAAVLVVFLVARGRSISELLVAAHGTTIVVATVALTEFFFPDRFPVAGPGFQRLSEPLGYTNALGFVAALGALLSTAFAVHSRARSARSLTAACLVVFALTIFFTTSRGAWIVLAIGIAGMLALEQRRLALLSTLGAVAPVIAVGIWLGSRAHDLTNSRAGAATQGHLLALVTVLLAAVAGGAPFVASLVERAVSNRRGSSTAAAVALFVVLLTASVGVIALLSGRNLTGRRELISTQSNHQVAVSLSGRIPLWRQAWHDWGRHRALGSGAGTFEQYWLEHRRSPTNVRNAHSLYLETLAELGPVGLGLLLLTLSVPFFAVARARRHPFAPAAFAAYLAFVIHAGGDWDWQMPAATLLGLCCGMALLLAVRPPLTRTPPTRTRAVGLAGLLALALIAFAGLIGNGALAASARAATAQHWQASASDARKAIRWLPWSSEAWWRLAVAQSEQGNPVAAQSSLLESIAKGPEEWRPWSSLVRLTTGRAQRRALREAARLNPRAPEVLQFLLAPGSLTQRWTYNDSWSGWPVTPLHRQHPIHGSFLDPRAGTLRAGGEASYHFGIDIGVRDDEPEPGAPPGRTHRVYAVEGGTAIVPPRLPSSCVDRKVEVGHFEYWHVDTSGVLRDQQHVRPGQMIGWTCKGLWHVHLAEWMELYGQRVYVNPIHPSMKLQPYADPSVPHIHAVEFFRPALPRWIAASRVSFPNAGSPLPRTSGGRALLSGFVDARAWIDESQPKLGRHFDDRVLASPLPPYSITLEVIRESDGRQILTRTVFRAAVFLSSSFATQSVPISYHYAPGTVQALPAGLCARRNGIHCGGVYWFRLFGRPTQAYWDTEKIANGNYRLRVTAWDAAGHHSSVEARVTIAN